MWFTKQNLQFGVDLFLLSHILMQDLATIISYQKIAAPSMVISPRLWKKYNLMPSVYLFLFVIERHIPVMFATRLTSILVASLANGSKPNIQIDSKNKWHWITMGISWIDLWIFNLFYIVCIMAKKRTMNHWMYWVRIWKDQKVKRTQLLRTVGWRSQRGIEEKPFTIIHILQYLYNIFYWFYMCMIVHVYIFI